MARARQVEPGSIEHPRRSRRRARRSARAHALRGGPAYVSRIVAGHGLVLEQVAVGSHGLGRERVGPGVRADELAEGAVDAGVGVAAQPGCLSACDLAGDRRKRAGVEQLAAGGLAARRDLLADDLDAMVVTADGLAQLAARPEASQLLLLLDTTHTHRAITDSVKPNQRGKIAADWRTNCQDSEIEARNRRSTPRRVLVIRASPPGLCAGA